MANKKKPFGIIAIAVYAAFSGVILLPSGLFLLLAGQTPGSTGLILTLYGVLACVLGVVLFASIFGLSSLQEWGRQSMFWVSLISIPLGVVSIFPILPNQQFTTGNTVLQLVGIGISLLILHYLTRTHVKALFASD